MEEDMYRDADRMKQMAEAIESAARHAVSAYGLSGAADRS